MKRLVSIGFRVADPVAYSVRVGLVDLCECYIYREAVGIVATFRCGFEYDSDCEDVVDFLKR